VALTVADDAAWRELVDIVGDERLDVLSGAPLAQRMEHHDHIDDVLAGWTAQRPAAEVATELQRAGVAACPAMTNRDLVEDPHLAARGFIAEWDQPDVGIMRFPGFPVHFERLPVTLRHAPSLGEHNEEVLRALGRNDAQLAALAAAGAIADEPPAAPSL
jgi:benzylsuccinate CoA-transferase BbsF subunit